MHPKTLKLFNELLSISATTDYEAHTVDGKLEAAVASFDNTTLVEVSISGMQDELHLYTSYKLMDKYIDFFDGPFNIKTNDKSILFFNDKLEALIPLVEKANCEKSTRRLKNTFEYNNPYVLKLPIEDLKFVLNVSKKLDDALIRFDMKEHLTIQVGSVKRKMKDLTGPEGNWCFKYDVIERVLKYAPDEITLYLPIDQDDLPVTAEYKAGALSVKAYIMRNFA